jgi:methionyl-tRNA synthetase
MQNKFYVTTPIYYVTAKPHLGSLYSTLLADVLSRWQKMYGKKTFFLTGTDEHGQKIAQAAEQAGKTPQEFVDSFIHAYKDVWKHYDIAYDYFVRTTSEQHKKGAQHFIKVLMDKGDIYKDTYTGWYCVPCETFVTEKSNGENGPLCISCLRPTTVLSEETYFFKLSAYQDKLLEFYKNNPNFIIPKERANEVISFVESGLKDLSMSRTTVKWGIPFPGDPKHTIYVWGDALTNYITAIGYGQKDKEKEFNFWWPADMHVLGKDIVRFHAVYWPAFLMAAGLALPKQLLVHGWIKVNKQKMSKSLGNVVDPIELLKAYGDEQVRFYLVRHMPVNQDGEFSTGELEKCIEVELANDLGNLLNRMVGLAEKNGVTKLEFPEIWSQKAIDLRDECWNALEDYAQYMEDCLFHLALTRLWKFIKLVNVYFHECEPWKLVKKDKEQFMQVLSATAHSLRIIAFLLWPIMPKKMETLLGSLGSTFSLEDNTIDSLEREPWNKTFVLKKIPTLFEKPEKKAEMEQDKKISENENKVEQKTDYIKIDDLIKVQLVVGTIEQCEEVEGSDKLLKMQIDFGEKGKRQILAGIRQSYQPEELIGKQGTFVFNLKPRKMLGMESQGMMLIAKDAQGKTKIISPEEPVPNGTQLQ